MGDEAKLKEIVEKQQLQLNAVLGTRKYDKISKSDILLLIRKIAIVTCGNPTGLPSFGIELLSKEYAYSNNELEKIQEISDKIKEICYSHSICFACTFLSVYYNNEISFVPIFRIVKDEQNVFVDMSGRVYNNWKNFVDNNVLPKCSYYCPSNGEYISTGVKISKFPSPPSPARYDNFNPDLSGMIRNGLTTSAAIWALKAPSVSNAIICGAVFVGSYLYDMKMPEEKVKFNKVPNPLDDKVAYILRCFNVDIKNLNISNKE